MRIVPPLALCALHQVQELSVASTQLVHGGDGKGSDADIAAATARAAVARLAGAMRALQEAEDEVASLLELAKDSDPDMRSAADEELGPARDAVAFAEAELARQAAPPPAGYEGNAVLEIRGGTGGREAALFALDLWRMCVVCPLTPPSSLCFSNTRTFAITRARVPARAFMHACMHTHWTLIEPMTSTGTKRVQSAWGGVSKESTYPTTLTAVRELCQPSSMVVECEWVLRPCVFANLFVLIMIVLLCIARTSCHNQRLTFSRYLTFLSWT